MIRYLSQVVFVFKAFATFGTLVMKVDIVNLQITGTAVVELTVEADVVA
jgi:hypothetical protein